jgi:hypothetical protein
MMTVDESSTVDGFNLWAGVKESLVPTGDLHVMRPYPNTHARFYRPPAR